MLVLDFDGEPPGLGPAASVDGHRLTVPGADPGAELARILVGLGEAASRLRSVKILRPSLESVYLPHRRCPRRARTGGTAVNPALAVIRNEAGLLRRDPVPVVIVVATPAVLTTLLTPALDLTLSLPISGNRPFSDNHCL
jgi:hypothetical protein